MEWKTEVKTAGKSVIVVMSNVYLKTKLILKRYWDTTIVRWYTQVGVDVVIQHILPEVNIWGITILVTTYYFNTFPTSKKDNIGYGFGLILTLPAKHSIHIDDVSRPLRVFLCYVRFVNCLNKLAIRKVLSTKIVSLLHNFHLSERCSGFLGPLSIMADFFSSGMPLP